MFCDTELRPAWAARSPESPEIRTELSVVMRGRPAEGAQRSADFAGCASARVQLRWVD